MQILIFRLKDYHFGILTENVIEIVKKNEVKSIPNSPEWAEGLINLRGEVLTLVNMLSLLKIDDFNLDDCYNNTVIVNRDENSIALIADEPTGNLNPEYAEEIMRLFYRINKMGTTIVMATHNWNLIETFPNRVIEMSNGKLVRDRTKNHVSLLVSEDFNDHLGGAVFV